MQQPFQSAYLANSLLKVLCVLIAQVSHINPVMTLPVAMVTSEINNANQTSSTFPSFFDQGAILTTMLATRNFSGEFTRRSNDQQALISGRRPTGL